MTPSPATLTVMATHQEHWDRHIEALDSFVEREGHPNVPSNHVEDEVNLGSWVKYVRGRYRKGLLFPARIEKLESYEGWSWYAPPREKDPDMKARDRAIRALREAGHTYEEIGEEFELTRQRIHQIVNGKA